MKTSNRCIDTERQNMEAMMRERSLTVEEAAGRRKYIHKIMYMGNQERNSIVKNRNLEAEG
jgi:hypothetical protein